MNAISKAIDHCRFTIPAEILQAIFIRRQQQWRSTPTTIDKQILAEVIRPRVFVDANLVGATEMYVPLETVPIERVNSYTTIYHIDKLLTQGRSIMSVLNITFADPTVGSSLATNATGCQSTQLLATAQGLMDSQGTIPVTSTAHVQLVGENTVMVRDTVLLPANVYLRCLVAHDETMSHLQIRAYRAFYKLVELAVKSYIYNTYAITMDIGELYGGQNIGRFKEIVDSYSDSEEMYQTYLHEVFAKVSLMNDGESMGRFIRLISPNRR